MRTARNLIFSAVLSAMALSTSVKAETPDEIRARILTQTKFKVVAAEALPAPVAQYKGDGDPTTLELVVFSNKSDGPSRVSDDGEVIFFYAKDSNKLQQQLIQKAFQIRMARALSAN